MNLTDDQIRSLRAVAEEAQAAPRLVKWLNGMPDGSVEIDAPSVLSLVEEVERLREIVADARIRLDDRATRLDEQSARIDALVAKAEAGKGLYEAFRHVLSECTNATDLPCARCRALARWEAVENG